jgi:uncharacterized protein YjbJ (UPF0337 family)
MNNDELKGKGENLKGRAKEAVGALSGDKRLQGEGLFDRLRGAVREKLGKGKDEASREVSRHERDVSRAEDDDE